MIVDRGVSPTGALGVARFSDCHTYRYTLERTWHAGLPLFVACLLNPSIADARTDDPTTRRMIKVAKAMGCGSYVAINCFAFVGTDPKDMKRADKPIGPTNNRIVRRYVEKSDVLFCGWGVDGAHLDRDRWMIDVVQPYEPLCYGYTQAGHPRFPLYLKKTAKLIPFEGRSA